MPLDRTGTLPGVVPLKLARLSSDAALPTLVYLSGGPGGAGIEEMLAVMPLAPVLTDRYRVVGFDQRGTGGSGLLRCPKLERDVRLRSSAAGADCARRLGAARTKYTTPDSVEDLEAIRVELGVERLTLFGISYGTELALAYARAHPDHVDRMILDSVVDPDDRDPFGLAGFRAMAPSLAALCPGRCRGVSRDPIADVAALAARLRRRKLRGRAYDRRGQRPPPLGGADRDLRPALRLRLQPAAARRVPAAVRAALAGDAAPLVRLGAEGDGLADLPVAEVVLQRPLRDRVRGDAAAVGRRDAVRGPARGGHAARLRAGAGGVRAVRPAHRRGGRDRALPRLAGRAVGPRRRRPRRRIPPCRR